MHFVTTHSHDLSLSPPYTLSEPILSITKCCVNRLNTPLNTPLGNSAGDTGNANVLYDIEKWEDREEREGNNMCYAGIIQDEDNESLMILAYEAFEVFLNLDVVPGSFSPHCPNLPTFISLS